MAGLRIEVNTVDIKRALGKKAALINSAIEKVVKNSAAKMAKIAKDLAPGGESGKLKRSIGFRVTNKGRYTKLNFTVKSIPGKRNPKKDPMIYWSTIEFGGANTGKMAIPFGEKDQYTARVAIDNPKLLGFKRLFKPEGKDVILGEVNKHTPIELVYILIDRVKQDPHPFLRPAMRQVIPDLKVAVRNAVKKIMEGSNAGEVSSKTPRGRFSVETSRY